MLLLLPCTSFNNNDVTYQLYRPHSLAPCNTRPNDSYLMFLLSWPHNRKQQFYSGSFHNIGILKEGQIEKVTYVVVTNVSMPQKLNLSFEWHDEFIEQCMQN